MWGKYAMPSCKAVGDEAVAVTSGGSFLEPLGGSFWTRAAKAFMSCCVSGLTKLTWANEISPLRPSR